MAPATTAKATTTMSARGQLDAQRGVLLARVMRFGFELLQILPGGFERVLLLAARLLLAFRLRLSAVLIVLRHSGPLSRTSLG